MPVIIHCKRNNRVRCSLIYLYNEISSELMTQLTLQILLKWSSGVIVDSDALATRIPHSHTFGTHVHAALPRHKVVAAPSAAWVDELLAHLGGCVVEIPRNGGRTLPFVHGVQAEHGNICKAIHKAQWDHQSSSLNHFLLVEISFLIVSPQWQTVFTHWMYEVLSQ